MKRRLARSLVPIFVPAFFFSCIPEPPPDRVEPPRSRPVIVRASVVPSPSAVLTRFPRLFLVPVELADPTEDFQWVAFIDYNAFTGTGRQEAPKTSSFTPSNTVGRIRTIEVGLLPPSPDRCHLIEVIVGRSFGEDQTGRRPVEPPGGDIVSWFYSPGGTLEGCPSLDVGGFEADGGAPEGGPP